jgi:hypothetical protein
MAAPGCIAHHSARVTVGTYATQWLTAEVQLKPTTRAGYEVALRRRSLRLGRTYRFRQCRMRGRRRGATAVGVWTLLLQRQAAPSAVPMLHTAKR